MKTTLGLFVLLLLVGCSSPKEQDPTEEINQEIVSGNFTRATELIDSLVVGGELNETQEYALRFTRDSLHRVRLDFNQTKDEIMPHPTYSG